MAKIAILSIPAFGHLNSQIHLARKLTARGHRVALYYHPLVAKYLGAEAFELVPYPNFDVSDIHSTDYIRALQYVISGIREVQLDILTFIPEFVFADGLAVWAGKVALETKAKLIYTTPLVQFSLPYLAKRPRLLFSAMRSGISHPFKLLEAALIIRRATNNRRSVSNIASSIPNPGLIFIPSYLQPDYNGKHIYVSESFNSSPTDLAAEFRRKFKRQSEKKLVYISLGTFFLNTELLKEIVKQVSKLENVQVIVSSNKLESTEFAENVEVYPYVDQTLLIPQADLVVFNGGTNTTRDCIQFRVPTIIVPVGFDQFVQAEQVEHLKVGIKVLEHEVDLLPSRIQEMLTNKETFLKALDKVNSTSAGFTLEQGIELLNQKYGFDL